MMDLPLLSAVAATSAEAATSPSSSCCHPSLSLTWAGNVKLLLAVPLY